MERFRISDRLQFGVNLSAGTLWIDHRDLTVRGTGITFNLQHSWGYLDKWHFNAGASMALDLSSSGVVRMPVDGGGCVEFRQNANGTFGPGSNGIRATLTKNSGGSFTARFIDSGETWAFNAHGWPLHRADRNGNAITYYFNSDGTLASVADSQGRVTRFVNSGGRISRVTDPSGAVVGDYTYDADGRLIGFTNREGGSVSMTYDGSRLKTLTDQASRVWRFTFTALGEVAQVTTPRPAGPVDTLFAYDSDTQTTQTDPNGNKTIYTFDALGRQVQAKDPLGHSQSRTWTASSDVQAVTDGLQNSTTGVYDSLRNLISTKLPTGATTTFGYANTALPNLPTSVKDPAGNELTREYDAAGNLTKIRSTPLAVDVEVRAYSGPRALLTSRKDANGNITEFTYDAQGNLTAVVPPLPMGQTRYTYDSLSRITSITDGAGKRIEYHYDRLDRIVAISHSGVALQAMTYDSLGNLTKRETAEVTTRFAYDTHPTGSQVTSAARTQGTATETVTYTYDKAGNLTSLTDPGGTTRYGYDIAYRLTSLADPFGQTTTFGYDAADRRTSTTFPGAGTQTNGYDGAGRLTSLAVSNAAGTELLRVTYRFTTAAGADTDQMQSKSVRRGNVISPTTTYEYDQLRHLTKETLTTYTVDKADNITAISSLTSTSNRTYNAANQLVVMENTTQFYDGAGNVTSSTTPNNNFWYSSTNQWIRGATAQGVEIFAASYDSVDQTEPRTISENNNGVATTHVFTHTALGITSAVVNGARTSVTRDPDGRLVTEKAGATRYNLITDHQGTVLALLDTSGALAAHYTYTAYGRNSSSGAGATNPFRYLGNYLLDSGIALFGLRYYNSYWGRFTSPDPTGQERNAYAYAQSDPINRMDPTGDLSWNDVGRFLDRAKKIVDRYEKVSDLVCYVKEAASDTDNSWADEGHDLNECFNPVADLY
ncbi:RHS repeat-associated core domain-containing protein [Phytohabitans sp. LJ34]|uniref:RHS repeat-associated core domain-containing protein n=1 Tax=Phytohabitans sp. LJ34 TaxID=3452217 RepID=UPI003F8BDFFE